MQSDQTPTENTLTANRQSQLESEYVTEFKDGSRVDAIDIITNRLGPLRGTKDTSLEYLQSKPKKRERQKLFLECLLFYDQSDSRRNRNKPQQ